MTDTTTARRLPPTEMSAFARDARQAILRGTSQMINPRRVIEMIDEIADLRAAVKTLPAAVERDEHDDDSTVGHRLIVDLGDCDLFAVCECGQALGTIRPDQPLEVLGTAWEAHTMGLSR